MPQDHGDVLLSIRFQVHHEIIGPQDLVHPGAGDGLEFLYNVAGVGGVGVDQDVGIGNRGAASRLNGIAWR